jgi:hypothetical protein
MDELSNYIINFTKFEIDQTATFYYIEVKDNLGSKWTIKTRFSIMH